MSPSHKLERIKIKARKVDFGFTDQLPCQWYDGNPTYLTFCNVISIMFPAGEQFFIDSVRHYKDKITNPDLQEDIAGFIAQEAMHSKQHELCNQLLIAQDKNIIKFQKVISIYLEKIKCYLPARTKLAISCALEHFTALFANFLLEMPSFKKQAHPVYARLWIWHAIEEIEHKAVCYDVYQHVAGGPLGYVERCLVMVSTSVAFMITIMVGFIIATRSSPKKAAATPAAKNNKRLIRNVFKVFFSKNEIVWYVLGPYLAYYMPFFHPWKQDNSQLIHRWKAEYENGLFMDEDNPPSQNNTLAINT
ncbi:MAG: metal-dependent hydrolase [Candidatus Methylumidiphilus sp.]